MPFSLAYFAAGSWIIGRTSRLIGRDPIGDQFRFLPSHCIDFTAPPPSWSRHEPAASNQPDPPDLLHRLSSIRRFSMPQRTCSPVSGFLPKLSCAIRIDSAVTIPAPTPPL